MNLIKFFVDISPEKPVKRNKILTFSTFLFKILSLNINLKIIRKRCFCKFQ